MNKRTNNINMILEELSRINEDKEDIIDGLPDKYADCIIKRRDVQYIFKDVFNIEYQKFKYVGTNTPSKEGGYYFVFIDNDKYPLASLISIYQYIEEKDYFGVLMKDTNQLACAWEIDFFEDSPKARLNKSQVTKIFKDSRAVYFVKDNGRLIHGMKSYR